MYTKLLTCKPVRKSLVSLVSYFRKGAGAATDVIFQRRSLTVKVVRKYELNASQVRELSYPGSHTLGSRFLTLGFWLLFFSSSFLTGHVPHCCHNRSLSRRATSILTRSSRRDQG